MNYILASKSPRRKEILENLGVPFEVVVADTDESSEETDPSRLVELLSYRKGEAVRALLQAKGRDLSDTAIISSDTVVEIDGEILGKPKDRADAIRMLALLEGRTHRVISGVCLLGENGGKATHEVTEVTFDHMTNEEIEGYVDLAQPYDKAGAYAIQGEASLFIGGIKGCYFNVVGLPVHRLNRLHREIFGENLL